MKDENAVDYFDINETLDDADGFQEQQSSEHKPADDKQIMPPPQWIPSHSESEITLQTTGVSLFIFGMLNFHARFHFTFKVVLRTRVAGP